MFVISVFHQYDRIIQVRGKLTQNTFAKSIQIAKITLLRYEKGERVPDADFICAICRVYNLDANWLLTGEKILTMVDDEIAQIPVYTAPLAIALQWA